MKRLRILHAVLQEFAAHPLAAEMPRNDEIFKENHEPPFSSTDGKQKIYHPNNFVRTAQNEDSPPARLFQNQPKSTHLVVIVRPEIRRVEDLTVVVLDRPRHDELLEEIRHAGARVKLIMDGDVAAGIMAAMEHRTGIDALMGIGGAPEAVLAACGLKCIGGGMQARLWLRDEADRRMMEEEGKSEKDVLGLHDLVAGENVFFAATGVTDGELLQGVRFLGDDRCHTQSLVMRSYSGTTRYIEAEHRLDKLRLRRDEAERAFSGIDVAR